jgi:hypothetical protein
MQRKSPLRLTTRPRGIAARILSVSLLAVVLISGQVNQTPENDQRVYLRKKETKPCDEKAVRSPVGGIEGSSPALSWPRSWR